MFRWLFRLIILFVILLFVNKYTTWFDDTKFGDFFNRFEDKMISFLNKSDKATEVVDDLLSDNTWSASWFDNIDWFTDDDLIWWSNYNNASNNQSNTWYIPRDYDIVFVDHANQYCVTPRWQRIENNNYIIAYKYPISANCEFEKRYCNNTNLDGSYTYHTCIYESMADIQSQGSLLDNNDITSLIHNNMFTYQEPEFLLSSDILDNLTLDITAWITSSSSDTTDAYDIQTKVWPGIVASSFARKYAESINNNGTGIISNILETQNDPNIHFLWRWEKNINLIGWETDQEDNALKSETLKKILKTWWPKYDSTYIDLAPSSAPINKVCTTPWWDILSNGQYTMAFEQSSASFPNICRSEIRYCLDGVLQWSYTNQNCQYEGDTIQVTITPNLSGVDLNAYQYQYYKDTIKYTYRITDYYRRYNNIPALNNNNYRSTTYIPSTTNTITTNQQWEWCWTEHFGIVPNGASVIWFESQTAGPNGCIWQVRYCIDGVLQWEFPYWYCE